MVAALLSAITLIVSGKRETRKWLRDSILQAEIQFLDASFRYPSKSLFAALRRDRPDSHEIEKLVALYAETHRAQNDALTHLRLLAGDKVVTAAERLHAIDEVTSRGLHSGSISQVADFEACMNEKWRRRRVYIRAVRASNGLTRGAAITQHLMPDSFNPPLYEGRGARTWPMGLARWAATNLGKQKLGKKSMEND